MEQRRLRLGDIVDDYCPRERRVTNHAIVAMVEEDVKQTRCTTCDAEHAYKGGAAPRRRKKDSTGALYKEVLAGITEGGDTTPVLTTPAPAPRSCAPPAFMRTFRKPSRPPAMAAHLTATMASIPTALNRSSRSRGSVSLKTRRETRLTSSKTVPCIDR